MPIVLDGSQGISTPMYGGAISSNAVTPVVGMKNKIINGACVIDQRNAGASVTLGVGNPTYTLDRWGFQTSQASKLSVQQNAGSVTPPVGFSNYLGITSLSAYSVGSGDYYTFQQRIEGFNTSDLGWGTANAKTITISFWVRSSLTGTFGGSLTNSAFDRSYPFSYTISAANTWEYETITIAGDTTGTWIGATNGIGIFLTFGLGVGSTYNGTAGSWQASGLLSATGATSVVGTNGATFYITGVQLEVGSTATSFDYRPYGTELQLCQRYYVQYGGTSTNEHLPMVAQVQGNTNANTSFQLPVQMRTTPSITQASTWQANIYGGSSQNINSFAISDSTPLVARLDITLAGNLGSAGQCARMLSLSTAARLNFSAEL